MAIRSRRYWDSSVFIAWLAEETVDGRVDKCRPVIKAAEAGQVIIVTSSLTLVEVIRLKGKPAFDPAKEDMIQRFFMQEYIVVRQLDRHLGEVARSLIWKHGFWPKDSVHVATALEARADQLDTFDDELCRKSRMIGEPPLVIAAPDLPEQLEFDEQDEDDQELGGEA